MHLHKLRRPISALAAASFPALLFPAQVPRPSPDLVIRLNNGSELVPSQHRGKVVALAFLLTDCPHCQHTTEVLSKLQTEYGPRGFQALGSAINEMASMLVPDFVARFKPTFPVGFNSRNAAIEYLQHSPELQMFMPQLVFIDRRGTIRAQYSGDDAFWTNQEANMREQIEFLLNEGKQAPKKK